MRRLSWVFIALAAGAASSAHDAGAAADAAGRYRIEQRAGTWWFVAPGGELFWSQGVNSVTTGAHRDKYDAARPGYAAWRYYRDDDQWATDSLDRLQGWGFNTLGGWHDERLRKGALAYCGVLHLGAFAGVPWNDMFADGFANQMDDVARRSVEAHRNDPNLLGWFTDNELAWYPDSLFDFHLRQPATSKTRARLVSMLRERYHDDFAALRKDFVPDAGIGSFAKLEQGGALKLVAGGDGSAAIQDFAGRLAERYYSVACKAVRKHDPAHLVLGDRYQGYCPDAVVRAAGRYVDVVSTNYDWPAGVDGYLPLTYLRRLHALSARPVLVTEYYAAATDNRSGDPNSGGLFVVVADQVQRAAVAKERLRMFAGEPYIVGAHWFAYADEPPHGRHDGEDYNFGLVDIHNAPYEPLITALTQEHGRSLKTHSEAGRMEDAAAARLAVPYLPGDVSLENVDSHLLGQLHPRPQQDDGVGELSLAWNEDAIYVTLAGNHLVTESLYAERLVPLGEGLLWNVSVAKAGDSTSARLEMLGDRASATPTETRYVHWQRGVRYGVTIAFSAPGAGKHQWQAGQEVALESELRNVPLHVRSQWKTSLTLAGAPAAAIATADGRLSVTQPPLGGSNRLSTEEAGP